MCWFACKDYVQVHARSLGSPVGRWRGGGENVISGRRKKRVVKKRKKKNLKGKKKAPTKKGTKEAL